jgi:cytochrome P450
MIFRKKTRVYINAWAIQRDPKVWERPEEFLPERFEDNPIDFKGQDFEFIPFGGGRRGCPGLTFGVASVEYVVANILYWLDWKLPGTSVKGEDLDMSEFNGLSVTKKIPLHLVPILYSP